MGTSVEVALLGVGQRLSPLTGEVDCAALERALRDNLIRGAEG